MNKSATHPILRVLGIRDYSLLWAGGSISMLGSQFSLIALPWLALQLTGDPFALGTVLALGGIPRAIMILIGGAVSDRFSPRMILLLCDWANFVLSGLIAVLIVTGTMQVWMLYVFSLVTGLLAGFVMPAASSIIPRIVPEEDLQAGNAISMGTAQLGGLIGPALAGIIIGNSTQGITIAFAIDAVSFAVSALAISLMRSGGSTQPVRPADAPAEENIWQSIRGGLRYLAQNDKLRFMFTIIAAINFLFTGPLLVGIPVLAAQRLPEGAQAFGFLMSAYAGGGLVGLLLAGVLPKPNGRTLAIEIIALQATFGVVLIGMGWITSTWLDFSLLLLLGIGNGYLGLVIFTWIQQRTPKEMLGRIMSMMMLSSMGLVPLSQILAGAVSKWDLTLLFTLAGGLILVMTCWAAFQPALKSLSQDMAISHTEQDQAPALDGLPDTD
jgi:MFS family permease